MYQKGFHGQTRLLAVAVAGACAVALSAAAARADTAKCIATISKATAKYELAVQKASGKCEDAKAKDAMKTPSCPDAKASAKISGALTKLTGAINKDCAMETVASLGFNGLVERCNGGTRNGLFCTRNQNCEGQCDTGAEIGGPCTVSSNCPAACSLNGTEIMEGGAPVSCKGNGATQCANKRACLPGLTTECTVDADCGGAPGSCVGKCSVTTATTCVVSGDCPAGESCVGRGSCSVFTGHCANAGTCDPADRCPPVVDDSAPFADCDAPLASIADVATCLACNANSSAGVATDFAYGARRPPFGDPGFGLPDDGDSGKSVLGCQRAIGKAVSKYFQSVRKATQKCTASLLKMKTPSCPDATLTAAIGKAQTSLTGAITKKCGGTLFEETLNGDQVLALDPLAPILELPNSGPNFGTSAETLMDKLASCSDGFAVPSILGGCKSNCGNGQIDIGEDCDDGNVVNGDACPADCKLPTACAVTGTKTVTFNVSAPASALPLGALKAYLAYDNTKVNLPGTGSGAAGAVTASAFSQSVNDLDSAIIVVVADPSDIGSPPFTVLFNVCSAASVSASDFSCLVQQAGAATGAETAYGVSCSVTVM